MASKRQRLTVGGRFRECGGEAHIRRPRFHNANDPLTGVTLGPHAYIVGGIGYEPSILVRFVLQTGAAHLPQWSAWRPRCTTTPPASPSPGPFQGLGAAAPHRLDLGLLADAHAAQCSASSPDAAGTVASASGSAGVEPRLSAVAALHVGGAAPDAANYPAVLVSLLRASQAARASREDGDDEAALWPEFLDEQVRLHAELALAACELDAVDAPTTTLRTFFAGPWLALRVLCAAYVLAAPLQAAQAATHVRWRARDTLAASARGAGGGEGGEGGEGGQEDEDAVPTHNPVALHGIHDALMALTDAVTAAVLQPHRAVPLPAALDGADADDDRDMLDPGVLAVLTLSRPALPVLAALAPPPATASMTGGHRLLRASALGRSLLSVTGLLSASARRTAATAADARPGAGPGAGGAAGQRSRSSDDDTDDTEDTASGEDDDVASLTQLLAEEATRLPFLPPLPSLTAFGLGGEGGAGGGAGPIVAPWTDGWGGGAATDTDTASSAAWTWPSNPWLTTLTTLAVPGGGQDDGSGGDGVEVGDGDGNGQARQPNGGAALLPTGLLTPESAASSRLTTSSPSSPSPSPSRAPTPPSPPSPPSQAAQPPSRRRQRPVRRRA